MSENEYRDLVLKDYKRQLKAGLLPFNLVSPTRKSLKEEAVKACSERYDPKDEPMLSSFFGSKEDPAAYVKAIQQISAEEFKTLHNYLNDEKIKTSFDNIRLLAWLIDFRPRPYHLNLPSAKSKEEPTPPGTSDPDGEPRPPKWLDTKMIIALTLLLVGGIAIGYWVYTLRPKVNGDEDCMIWSNDHFQPVYCKDQLSTTLTWPINHKLVKAFKRITRPDTLTYYSVKKAYWMKFNDRYEFFTTDGPSPLDTNKRLLPMSKNIFENHVLHIRN